MKNALRVFCLLYSAVLVAQSPGYDAVYARKMFDTLASPWMMGRGYVKEGDERAANQIATEFVKLKIEPFKKLDYYQQLFFDVNTFPHEVEVSLNNKTLKTGAEFIINPDCPSFKGELKVVTCPAKALKSVAAFNKFRYKDNGQNAVLIDYRSVTDAAIKKEIDKAINQQLIRARAIIVVKDKLTWSVSQTVGIMPIIEVLPNVLPKKVKTITINIESEWKRNYRSQNVIGFVRGTQQPDSFIVFTAHYDHLGILGHDAIFTGANDNASGTAMLLTLAKYYSQNPSKYSIAFIAFGGEELGLLGSMAYVENPAFPLEKIKFLVNMDIMGTGDDGITVVNGVKQKAAFDTLTAINTKLNLLKEIKIRSNAANSDHYFFAERGVPAVFIYTMGQTRFYHDVFDTRETLPLVEFPDLFTLLTQFVAKY